jgi:hypothetical protein
MVVDVKIVLMLAVGAAVAFGQASVEGSVVNASTGLPVSKASVLLSGPGSSIRDSTDAAGRFVFSAIPAGEYSVSVERPGFAKLEVGRYGPSGTQLRDGDHLSGIVLRIHPEGLIAGLVVGPDGKPLPGPLRLWKPTVYGGRTILIQVRRPTAFSADADGTFVIGGLEAGRYFLAAQRDPVDQLEEMQHRGLSTTYYPDTTALERAKPIDLRAGESARGLRITVQKTGVYRIAGRGASPVAGLQISEQRFSLSAKDPLGKMTVLKGAEMLSNAGAFQIRGVPPGDYILNGSIKGQVHGRAAMFSAEKEIHVTDRDVTGVDIVFEARTAKLTGVARGLVSAKPAWATQAFITDVRTSSSASGRIAADGTFGMEVPPGEYRVSAVNGPQNERAPKSVVFEGKEVLGTTFPVTLAGGALRVVFAETRKVTGVVRDKSGKPVAGAAVVLWTVGGAVASVTSDLLGRFTMRTAREGVFRIVAWEDLDTQTAQLPEFLAAFASQAVDVKIAGSGPGPVEVRAIPRSSAEAAIAKLP